MEKNIVNEAIDKLDDQRLAALVKTENAARQNMLANPTESNIRAHTRANQERIKAQQEISGNKEDVQKNDNLKNNKDVLLYLKNDLGRKIGKSKLYNDITKGLLRRDKNLGFSKRDVDKYATTLPTVETPEYVNREVWDVQRRKDEADIRIKEADAKRKELLAGVAEGKLIQRDIVDQELAARAVTFNAALKTAFEAHALECIQSVGGQPKLAHRFLEKTQNIIDDCSNKYAQPMEIEVSLEADLETFSDTESINSDTE